jgi:hypothetical protein
MSAPVSPPTWGHTTPNSPRPLFRSVAERRETAQYRSLEPTHVWVTTEAGRNPGLLVEWRKPDELPWEGRVVHLRARGGSWVQTQEWVPGDSLEPLARPLPPEA